MNAIEIEGLEKTYRGKRFARVDALRGVNLTIHEGEVFGFLGPNGAGKSTTIKILMGLIKSSQGSATILGTPVQNWTARRAVGYLPENPSFYDYLSADEYLRFTGSVYGMEPATMRDRIDLILKRLDLHESRRRLVRTFSKGMVQRLGIAQVLLHDPAVYILDEPMSGLDPVGRALVKEIILELKQMGKTVFFSTHITADVEEICDRVGILVKGELKRVERVDSVLTSGIVEYQVRYRLPNQQEEQCRIVSADQLVTTLGSLREEGNDVILVEPRSKRLEHFFLSVVRGE
jgi:ABC-2 type transport system ATP-binding protein